MVNCERKIIECGEEELLQQGVHKAGELNDDLFTFYLDFLDVLITHQVEQELCQGSQS